MSINQTAYAHVSFGVEKFVNTFHWRRQGSEPAFKHLSHSCVVEQVEEPTPVYLGFPRAICDNVKPAAKLSDRMNKWADELSKNTR